MARHTIVGHFCDGSYHVTFDLDLEQTLDACSPGDHCVQVSSQSSQLSRRRNFRKMFSYRQTDGRTDGRTDGQTDDGRRAIVLAHGMS